jgi:lipopolysaccharide transport system permease protein
MLDFLIDFAVLLGVMLWFDVMPSFRLLVAPPLLVISALLALAIGLWLGPINVRFRDVKYTLPFMLQIWMYATPIVYPLSIVPAGWKWLYSLNPMVGVVEGFRWAVFGKGDPNVVAIGISLAAIGFLLTGGLIFFKRMERSFADLI